MGVRFQTRLPAVLLAVLLALTACTGGVSTGSSGAGRTDPPGTVHVIAGSELRDLGQPFLDRMRAATGVNVVLDATGTLDAAERISSGDTGGAAFAWLSSDRYLQLLPGTSSKVLRRERIMLSPVVLGVKHSTAARLGWADGAPVTWADIAKAASSGGLKYGMTSPASSNSGFSALLGVATALSGSGDAVTAQTVNAPALKGFFSGQTLTSGSSGYLADLFLKQQDTVDGIINYESVLLGLNAGGQLHEPLDLVYPTDGVVTADYPLLLLDAARRAEYDKVAAYLISPGVQRDIATSTRRRPVVAAATPAGLFLATQLIELPFPASLDAVNGLVTAYLDTFRKPTNAVFVLDLSGSMSGSRIAALKRALLGLTGEDTSVSGRFARFREGETITFVTFASTVKDVRTFVVNGADPADPALQQVRRYVDGLQTGGGTAVYSAVARAYAEAARTASDRTLTSVVVMTDGENNQGIGVQDLVQQLPKSGPAAGVRAFAIQFGEASPDELEQIADATDGKVFSASGGDLSSAFKEIRGYQ